MSKLRHLQLNQELMTINPNAIPDALKKLDKWICWRLVDGKKIPYGGRKCTNMIDFTKQRNWLPFNMALQNYLKFQCTGIGFVLEGSGIIGVDLDDCVEDGTPSPEAITFLDNICADYIEFSPSGKGLRSFGYGELDRPLIGSQQNIQYEVYAKKRYLTVTGNCFRGKEIASFFDFSAILNPHPLASISSVSLVSSVSSVNSQPLHGYEIPDRLIPNRLGKRNALLFKLARHLLGVFPGAQILHLKPIVEAWHRRALPFIGTKPFEESWLDFCYGYAKVKYPEGSIGATFSSLPELPEGMMGMGQFGVKGDRLLQICLALSQALESGIFFLPSRKTGEWLDINHVDASKLINALSAIGAIELVEQATNTKARRFRLRDPT
jgi:hypothetical protein